MIKAATVLAIIPPGSKDFSSSFSWELVMNLVSLLFLAAVDREFSSISCLLKPVIVETSASNNFFIELSGIDFSNSIALDAKVAFFSKEPVPTARVNLSIKYSDNSKASLSLFSKVSLSSFSNKLAGSSPSGRKRNFISAPSLTTGKTFLRAPQAAPLPASSPSKQNITSFTSCNSTCV